jgi:phosphate:Na+ symporter
MDILGFLSQLAGAILLMLFAVRMVRTGIERAFGPRFQRLVRSADHPLRAAFVGTGLAVVLQSSAAVAVLVAGFAGSGSVRFGVGLMMVLGADLGSALLIQILTLPLDALVPVLLATGGLMFLKTERRNVKQAGRIILGVALILIALRFLRETVEPISDSTLFPALSYWLARDFVTAFLVGAALAFMMHSSVATILMIVTVVAIGALPPEAGLSLVLGANLGSALIPVWLSRGLPSEGRLLLWANLMLRGGMAIVVLFVTQFLNVEMLKNGLEAVLKLFSGLSQSLGSAGLTFDAGQSLVLAHIGFNLLVLLIGVPLRGTTERLVRMLWPDLQASQEVDLHTHHRSMLDETALGRPRLALVSLRREVLRIAQLAEEMITPALSLYLTPDKCIVQAIHVRERLVNTAFDDARSYGARLAQTPLSKADSRELGELLDYSFALEAAADIVATTMTSLAKEKSEKQLRFSVQGQRELEEMHRCVLVNLDLASRVLISGDVESARLLLQRKDEMRALHRDTRKRHLKRLTAGETTSLHSSDIHLETANALKEFNAQVAAIALPILFRHGHLRDTRLIDGSNDMSLTERPEAH